MKTPAWTPGAWAAGLLLAAAQAQGAPAPQQVADLADLSLEQLTRVTVTSPSRRAERLIDVAASIYVITAEDIRRSGATSIPEVLRLAPNLHVARADNNQYAISARGFNNVLANKMLVLIDGRTVYSPLFSGVFWEAQDVLLEDVERIEVISGPAATVWGTNGANGVISITTHPAAATQGLLAGGGAGNRESQGLVRYGGELGGGGHYRVYAKTFEREHDNLSTGPAIRDESTRAQAGFRADWEAPGGTTTLQGDAYRASLDQLPSARSISGVNLLGRWTRQWSAQSSTRLQVYYDRTEREHPQQFKEALDTFDLDFQNGLEPWTGHRLVWGAGYRTARDRVENTASQAFIPADRTLHWGNVFAQDEVALGDALSLTLGARLENNLYTGNEWLPTARLAWRFAPDHLLWAGLSRAVRAPSRIDRDVFFPGVPPFVLVANDTFRSEASDVAELGYRAQFSTAFSLSLTAFHHEHRNLRSLALVGRSLVFANSLEGRTTGLEGWASYRISSAWRLAGGFTVMDESLHPKPGEVDLGGQPSLGNDPKHWALLRSSWDLGERHEVDLDLRHVGALSNPVVPAYTALDARVGWKVSRALELSLALQNVLDSAHVEWGDASNRAEFGRAAFVKILWRM